MSRKRNRAYSNRAPRPLHQDRAPRDIAPDMNAAVSRDAGYPEASAFLRRHVLRQRRDMVERDNSKLCRRAKWAIGLCAVAPYSPTDPFRRYALTDLVHLTGSVAVRDDARIRHTESK